MGTSCGIDKKVIVTRQPNHMNEKANKFYKNNNRVVEEERFVKIIEADKKKNKKNKGLPDKFFIKTISGRKYISKERFESIKEDIKVLCHLNHPNILKYYDLCGTYKKFHIVTEYCSGTSLEMIRVDSPSHFSESRAAKIIKQLLQAVSYLNANKLSHRNLTPENILVEAEDLVKIINFEQSKIDITELNLQKKDGMSIYTAPEISKNDFNHKCDVWSVGVIAYKLI
jgi:calcium-dependent protein kinase